MRAMPLTFLPENLLFIKKFSNFANISVYNIKTLAYEQRRNQKAKY